MTVEAVTKQVAEHRNPIDLFINDIEQMMFKKLMMR
jgi:hypothetical protein